MKKLLSLLLLLIAAPAFGQGSGFFVRANCSQITSPVANSTACLQTTTASGRTAGEIYVWTGAAYVQVTQQGGGAGISQLTGDVTAGPGTGSQAATIAANAVTSTKIINDAVTTAKIANGNVTLGKISNAAASSKLLGSGASGSGSSYDEITLGTNLSMSGTTLNASGGGGGCSTSGSSILQGDGAGGCSNVTVGTGLDFTGGTLSATGGSSGLTLVENKTVTSNSTTVTFSGLNGNTDGVYILQARIINNSGGNTKYTMQPNGVSTNQSSYFHYNINGLAGVNAATWMLTDDTADVGNGVWMNVAVTIWAKNNPNSIAAIRQYQGMLGIATTAPAATSAQIAGVWNETSTNLTSLDVVAANANGIGNGSTLALYKYAQ